MKKFGFAFFLMAAPVLCAPFLSFDTPRGGDVFQIYLNGKQIHQQFVHLDNSARTLHLASFNESDKIEVMYSHCGMPGKGRVLTVRNEKNETVKEFRFADAANARSLMGFYRKDVGKIKSSRLNLHYSSTEIPGGKLLAILDWKDGQMVAKR